jgi:hypothetical protein
MSDPNSYEIFTETVTQATAPVRLGAPSYAEGKNEAFVEDGIDPDIRDRLCGGCTEATARYCGAVVARVVTNYPDKMVPPADRPTLDEKGVKVLDGDGYALCARRFIANGVTALLRGNFIIAADDPLAGSTEGQKAVETIRRAADDTMAGLRKGIRL